MSKIPKKIWPKLNVSSHFRSSFVCKNIPFVALIKAPIAPFVRKNTPLETIRHTGGFTLIELMVTVVVAGILVAIAVPNMRTMIQNMRITTQTNEFITDLNFARSEAIKRAANVTICKSVNSTTATPTCSTAASPPGWETGRIIFVDSATAPNGQYDAGEPLLRIREPLEINTTLSNALNLIVYARTGATTAGATVDFNLCDARGNTYGRKISIELTGRTTLTKPAAAGC